MEDDNKKFEELNPEEIFFTKDIIKQNFSNGEYEDSYISIVFLNEIHIRKSLNKIMKVTIYDNKFYSLNNKILYCAKHSQIPIIKVEVLEFNKCKEDFFRKLAGNNGGKSVRLENEPEIKEIIVHKLCLQCLPCKHDCKIEYLSGEVLYKKRLSGVKILRLMIDNHLPINTHLAKYYITDQRKVYLGI